jgi:signal transduction histidine kinase
MNAFETFRKSVSFSAAILSVCLVTLIIFSALFYYRFNSFVKYSEQTAHTYSIIDQIEKTESILKDVETGTRGFIITKDTSFLQPLFNASRLLKPTLDSLGKLVRENSRQAKLFDEIRRLALLKLKLSEAARDFSMFNALQHDSLYISMIYRKQIMDQFRSAINHLIHLETDELAYRKKEMEYYRNKLPNNFTLIFISALLISLAFGMWTFVELRRRRMYQASLEENIVRLNQNNAELEQIAFAASHDLQEPLRKIRIFSDRLKMISSDKLQGESADIVKKINRFAAQLHGLISDLVNLINAVQASPEKDFISLHAVITAAEKSFEKEIQSCGCKIVKSDLPVAAGSFEQVKTLFSNLFSNSLHFISPKRKPVIIISTDVINGTSISNLPKQLGFKTYNHVKFKDNGIGFDPAFTEKLFLPFQKLHNYSADEISRKGMGLAICKRIMVNLGGWIAAEGREDEGVTIHLYFPVAERLT